MYEASPEQVMLIRTLIPDTDAIFGDGRDEYMLEDSQIQAFFEVARGNILRAAGYACIAIGNSEAIISKVIKTQDLSTSGADVANSLRENGKVYLARADKEDQDADWAFFQIIDFPVGDRPPELTERPWSWA